jgi:thymidylate kinase
MKDATLLPDIVIYFAVDTQTALQRRVKRGEGMADAIEMKGVGYQELVRKSFEKYIERYNGNPFFVFKIDANQDLDSVKRDLDTVLEELASIGTEGAGRALQGSL